MLFGAAGRIRTADLILTKDALYRLSYSSKYLLVILYSDLRLANYTKNNQSCQ